LFQSSGDEVRRIAANVAKLAELVRKATCGREVLLSPSILL